MLECIALRSKVSESKKSCKIFILSLGFHQVYAVRGTKSTITRAKGVNKTTSRKISFETFFNTWKHCRDYYALMHRIRTRICDVSTVQCLKKALSIGDDKRWMPPGEGQVQTLALGHWRIPNNNTLTIAD